MHVHHENAGTESVGRRSRARSIPTPYNKTSPQRALAAGGRTLMVVLQASEIRKRLILQRQYDALGADLCCLQRAIDAEPDLPPTPPPPEELNLDFAPTSTSQLAWPSRSSSDVCQRPGCCAEELTMHEERTFALLASISRVDPGPLPADVLRNAQAPPPWPRAGRAKRLGDI